MSNPTEEIRAEDVPVEDCHILDLTDDMYTGALPSDCLQDFVCMLCYGIVIKPIKCTQCETLVCRTCYLNDCKEGYNARNNKGKGAKLKFECFKKCGGREFVWNLNKVE